MIKLYQCCLFLEWKFRSNFESRETLRNIEVNRNFLILNNFKFCKDYNRENLCVQPSDSQRKIETFSRHFHKISSSCHISRFLVLFEENYSKNFSLIFMKRENEKLLYILHLSVFGSIEKIKYFFLNMENMRNSQSHEIARFSFFILDFFIFFLIISSQFQHIVSLIKRSWKRKVVGRR